MKEIPLTKDKIALVDDEDFEYLNQWKWHARYKKGGSYYASRKEYKTQETIQMHRVILELKPYKVSKLMVDHKDGNGLNNQRYNIRPATNAENNQNRASRKNSSSQYKGVCWDKERNKWVAIIGFNGKHKKLGRFDNEEEAAKAYDNVAKELHGKFAKLNF